MGSSVDPSPLGYLVSLVFIIALVWLIYECVKYREAQNGGGQFKQPRWARDKAEIKQGPLNREEAAGYVEAKLERFK